jgi:YqjK-like protein
VTRQRLIALSQQRTRLVERARAERERLDTAVGRIESALSWIEVVEKGVDGARRHPLLVLAAVALLVALRPRGAIKLAASGLSLWRLYVQARRLWTVASALAASVAAQSP